eukprot:scaffold209784_cov31-Tisochrysis_lutea.AAC.3
MLKLASPPSHESSLCNSFTLVRPLRSLFVYLKIASPTMELEPHLSCEHGRASTHSRRLAVHTVEHRPAHVALLPFVSRAPAGHGDVIGE